MVEAVVKVGGSLTEYPQALKKLCKTLSRLSHRHRLLIVPGGGPLADAVRALDRKFSLPPQTAHRMAVLAMDQFGLLLHSFIPASHTVSRLEEVEILLGRCGLPIFLPSRFTAASRLLRASWDVTSDSIAAFLALRLKADKLLLLKDVDGIFTQDPKKGGGKLIPQLTVGELQVRRRWSCVDAELPRLLAEGKLTCFVVNGRKPERMRRILEGRSVLCSEIVPD
ncbi:hypothetical protein [Candidatus Hecatella orcuttiae]|jgi:aspartokinase-like uncharacterized kinase|uniref:amino acid kinase family protein n=1 Tax=Candidatus Hecatella orcuttiae TaxID=1935119 RepID=UPI002867C199|nr:hypothetical protein [Candidatus Hecatella orcuttiae]